MGGGKIQGGYLTKCPLSELPDMRAPSGTFLARKIGEYLQERKKKGKSKINLNYSSLLKVMNSCKSRRIWQCCLLRGIRIPGRF